MVPSGEILAMWLSALGHPETHNSFQLQLNQTLDLVEDTSRGLVCITAR